MIDHLHKMGSIVTGLSQPSKERAGGKFFFGGAWQSKQLQDIVCIFFPLRRAVDGMLIFFTDTHYRSLLIFIFSSHCYDLDFIACSLCSNFVLALLYRHQQGRDSQLNTLDALFFMHD